MDHAPYGPDRLAYWYFRLNGFLTTENFVIHPERGHDQRTDADVLALRFTDRVEGGKNAPLGDDPVVAECATPINVVIAEVKRGRCGLNGPWTNPEAGNMREVLRAIGCVPFVKLGDASSALFSGGSWSHGPVSIRLFALGEYPDEQLPLPQEQQIAWEHVIMFVLERFRGYRNRKSAVGQWADDGKKLQEAAVRNDIALIRALFGLRPFDDELIGRLRPRH
jgi:hypothetical protein